MAATIQTLDLGTLLKDIPPGAWVAISRDGGGSKVLSYSADMKQAIDRAKELGEEHPIIIRVPETQAALLL
jgi:hypothetical protein